MKQATRSTSAGKTPVKPAKDVVNRVAVWFQPVCHLVWIPSDEDLESTRCAKSDLNQKSYDRKHSGIS